MFPYFGTFLIISAFTFGVTMMSMMARKNEHSMEVIQPASSVIQTTEIINITDISDVICDCIAVSSCRNLAQINNDTKYCGAEDDVERKICCPIDFGNSMEYMVNRIGPETNYEDTTNSNTQDYEVTTELPDVNTNDDNLSASRALLNDQVVSQNQISYKTHKNFHLLPHWKECGVPLLNLINPGARKTRIVGGDKVDVREYPWMARLGFIHKDGQNESIVYKCAGTVLSQRYVVGAAHCITNFGVPVKILVQTTTGMNISVKSERVIVHQGYKNSKKANDIMLIRLGDLNAVKTNLTNTTSIKLALAPVCLPFFMEHGVDVTNLRKNQDYVLGWGVYTWNSTKLSDSLKKLDVPTIDNPVCNKMYGNYFQVTERQICAGGIVGEDTCQGDSGGPLATSYDSPSLGLAPVHVQLGITSFGSKLCGKGVPGVYSRISYYLQWILDSIEP